MSDRQVSGQVTKQRRVLTIDGTPYTHVVCIGCGRTLSKDDIVWIWFYKRCIDCGHTSFDGLIKADPIDSKPN